MPEVTIDTEDLEALLFAAGAANASPEAKKILKRDPQFEQVEGRLTDACKNAGDAWRKSKRAKEWPDRFKVDEYEIRYLKLLVARGAGRRLGMQEEVPVPRSYITKGLVELGIYSESVTWSNSGTDHLHHEQRRVRITSDAVQILANSAFDVGPPARPAPADEVDRSLSLGDRIGGATAALTKPIDGNPEQG